LNLPANIPLNFVAVGQMTAKRQSDKMAPGMEVCMKQRCVIEFLHVEKIAPNDIHRRFLNFYGDQSVDVSTVTHWMARFSSANSDMNDKPHSRGPCTADTPQNEECLYQLIHGNWRITTRELCTELNIGFKPLEVMVATLEISQSLRQVGLTNAHTGT
jgi:transposase